MNYVTEIHTDDDAAISFNEEGKAIPEYPDDIFTHEEAMEDENARYSGVIRELTEFESLMQTLGK